MTDRLALLGTRKRGGTDQVDDLPGKHCDACIAEFPHVRPVDVGLAERPDAGHVDDLVVRHVGAAEDCGLESVDAELTNHKGRHLRIAFVGFNEYVWKIG